MFIRALGLLCGILLTSASVRADQTDSLGLQEVAKSRSIFQACITKFLQPSSAPSGIAASSDASNVGGATIADLAIQALGNSDSEYTQDFSDLLEVLEAYADGKSLTAEEMTVLESAVFASQLARIALSRQTHQASASDDTIAIAFHGYESGMAAKQAFDQQQAIPSPSELLRVAARCGESGIGKVALAEAARLGLVGDERLLGLRTFPSFYIRLLNAARDEGSPAASLMLGLHQIRRDATQRASPTSLALLWEAIERGSVEAEVELYIALVKEVERFDRHGAKLLERATELRALGVRDASYLLACLYLYGIGVDQDNYLAARYLSESVVLSSSRGRSLLEAWLEMPE